ncbi:MAG: hypothetical protein MUE50_22715 [Pirellulaceae bacterium]|nr:hypothetical protein [Pirellulaceae bacterium]
MGPDGCLGDTARPGEIAYKQGDGDAKVHDWFYEATAAGVVMQAEIVELQRLLLANHHRMQVELRAIVNQERFEFLRGRLSNVVAPAAGNRETPAPPSESKSSAPNRSTP